MEHYFYKGRLTEEHGLEVIVPDDEDRGTVHRIIYEKLVTGTIDEASRTAYREITARLVEAGAEAIILGCTEIMLLVRPRTAVCRSSTRPLSTPRPPFSQFYTRCQPSDKAGPAGSAS